ncbi:hypothetical protein I656_00599 [Geobacillus sp. WSUCF1]|nr:hypothetical protein I656_00599 [Geobacillus sp. WSUCF1]
MKAWSRITDENKGRKSWGCRLFLFFWSKAAGRYGIIVMGHHAGQRNDRRFGS